MPDWQPVKLESVIFEGEAVHSSRLLVGASDHLCANAVKHNFKLEQPFGAASPWLLRRSGLGGASYSGGFLGSSDVATLGGTRMTHKAEAKDGIPAVDKMLEGGAHFSAANSYKSEDTRLKAPEHFRLDSGNPWLMNKTRFLQHNAATRIQRLQNPTSSHNRTELPRLAAEKADDNDLGARGMNAGVLGRWTTVVRGRRKLTRQLSCILEKLEALDVHVPQPP